MSKCTDQIFRARPADSSKNKVWTLSLRKVGQVYISMVGSKSGNCQQPAAFVLVPKNLQACYLWWRIAQFNLTEQSDWFDNMPIHSYNYAQWTCPDPIFRQGRRARAKNLVFGAGDETSQRVVSSPDPTYERGSGDIRLIPRASLTLITFWREISLRQSHCRKHNLQCNTGNPWLLRHDDTALFLARKLVISCQLCIQQAMNF